MLHLFNLLSPYRHQGIAVCATEGLPSVGD